MQAEPDGEIQHHADYRCGNGGQRTGLFVPAFNRLFVALPHRGLQSARVLVYEVKGD